jgi:hypothetical protein
MHPIQKTLIACSAAVSDIVTLPECRADAKRHAMVGAFVLLTACFAFASGGFAVYTGFRSVPMALAIGFAWALLIFTIDRFVVSGIRKVDVEGLPFLTRSKKHIHEWLITAPRLGLAALISIVIATPLELRFFEREINTRIAVNELADSERATKEIDRQFVELQTLRGQNAKLNDAIIAARAAYQQMNDRAVEELAGLSGTGQSGPGPVYEQRKVQAQDLAVVWEETRRVNSAAIRSNEVEISRLEKQRQTMLNKHRAIIAEGDGFLARYQALGQLASSHSDVRTARTFMTLLFLCIELTPVLMKLLLRRGPYDEILETLEHTVRVEQLKARSDLNDDTHADVIVHSLRNQRRIAAEEELTRTMSDLDTLTQAAPRELEDAQRRVARATINDWTRNQVGPPKLPRVPIFKP